MKTEQLVPDGFCLECRFCCRFAEAASIWTPHLSQADILAFDGNDLCGKFFDRTKKTMATRPSRLGNHFVCACLTEEDHKCGIYPFRPMECGLYPFLINRSGGRFFLALDTHCKYVRENKDTDAFKKGLEKALRSIQVKELFGMIKEDPSFAQEYEDAENVLEITG